jgi:membrane-associated phospholipid phosphatase
MYGWLALNTLVVTWRAPAVATWPLLLLGNALAFALIRLLQRAQPTRSIVLLGGAYGLLLTLAYYTQLGILATDVGHLHDQLVQRWEAALFGGQVSVTWHARAPSLALSWVMHFCYGSYYWLAALPPLFLFFRRSQAAFERGAFVVTLAFYVCYTVFALFPVAGPRYFYGNATGPIAELLPARIVHALLEGGSAYGTAFPSSHVAVSWCAVLSLWRDARGLALLLAPIALGLALGAVYGQFHYGVDALAGAALALALTGAAEPVRRALGRAARA